MRPKQIKVASQSISILDCPDWAGDEEVQGTYDEDRSCIVLRKRLSPSSARLALLHELIHSYVWLGGIRSDLRPDGNDKIEERVCDVMSVLLLDTIRRNPALIRYLTAKD